MNVSCVSTSFCAAVGQAYFSPRQTMVEMWNGSQWSILSSPSPGTSDNYLSSVSCLSVISCVSVGSDSSGGAYQTLIEAWNGTAWSIVPSADPVASDNTFLTSVSCVTANHCFGAGYYYNSDQGSYKTLVEAWDGNNWSIVPSPDPSPGFNYLNSVSCASITYCAAVGHYNNSSDVPRTLIATWNGTSWSLVSSPNNGADSNDLTGTSCVSDSSCTTVGTYIKSGVDQTLAEAWNGTNWSLVTSPDQRTSQNLLDGVSCISASFCVAVGSYFTNRYLSQPPNLFQPLIEAWNGTKWSTMSSPEVGIQGYLNGVSCTSTSSCTAVGSYVSNALGLVHTLIEVWNGSRWLVAASPNNGRGSNYLNAVSCYSTTSCTAVGYYTVGDINGLHQTLIEAWNGSSWSRVPSPDVGPGVNVLAGVSCVSVTSCTAVGSTADNAGAYTTLIEAWNGTGWSTVTSPNGGPTFNQLYGVSCVSASTCSAVGYTGSSQSLIEAWDGTNWSIVSSPSHGPYTTLNGISCVSANSCTAVGVSGSQSLIDAWDGSSWSTVSNPNNGIADALNGVSCAPDNSCAAAGTYTGTDRLSYSLIEMYG